MILYLHGFLSTGQSYKAQWFKRAFSELDITVFTPTYPLADPAVTIEYLKHYIEENILIANDNETPPAWQIFGSSMGGFYGEILAEHYGVPLLMINPALDPVPTFQQYLGEHIHPITGEHIRIDASFIKTLEALNLLQPVSTTSLVLLDKEDEVIPYEFAFTKYHNAPNTKVLVFEGGDHAFPHLEQAWLEVRRFVTEN